MAQSTLAKLQKPGNISVMPSPRVALVVACTFITAAACGSGKDDGDGRSGGSQGDGDMGGSSNETGLDLGQTTSPGGADQSTDAAGDGDGDLEACASSEQDARLTEANLLFVVDRSGSMNCNAPEYTEDPCVDPEKQAPSEPSKWEETREALSGALQALVGRENVNVGLTMFPKPDELQQCLVSTEPDIAIKRLTKGHKQDIDQFLDEVAPQGETPIAGASLTSYAYLAEELVAGRLAGNTFVVLFTDGQETCDVNEEGQPTSVFENFVEQKVEDATLFNIRTFVIGAPGSEGARSSLSEIAFRGSSAADDECDHGSQDVGTGDCHFDMTESTDFIGDLSTAFTAITSDKALSCIYDVPDGKVDLNKVNVTYEPGDGKVVDVLRDESKDCDDGAEGWQYTADFTKIVLCGDICDEVKDQAGLVRIVLGCPSQIIR